MPHTCSNYSQKVFDTLQQLSPPEMWWIIWFQPLRCDIIWAISA
jgi:hypothetical protein